jgi:large subunit ribosomal protein L31e
MADKIERIYTIPLRRKWLKEPRSKRSNRALRTVKDFIKRHTKAEEIKISRGVGDFIFSRGFKKPPATIKVEVKGDLTGVDVKIPGEVIVKKEEKKKGIAGLKERLTGKGEEKEKPEKKEKKKETEKKETGEKEPEGKEAKGKPKEEKK